MSIEVMVITNGSSLGEDLLRIAWNTAQRLFQEYRVEVYVIPFQVRKGRVAIIINGLEFPVTRPLSVEELSNLILTAASSEGKWENDIVLGASLIDEGPFGNGVTVAT
jgi:hypothetical protein